MVPHNFGRTLIVGALTLAFGFAGASAQPRDDQGVLGAVSTAQALKALLESIEKLNAHTVRQQNCHAVVANLVAGKKIADITEKADCALESQNPDALDIETALGTISGTVDPMRTELTAIEILFAGMVPPRPTTRPEPEKEDDGNLRLHNVLAGHLDSANYCQGKVPLQQLVVKCFGKVKTDDAMPGGEHIQLLPDGTNSCYAKNVTVRDLCGYDPAPEGKHSIRVIYRCGNSVTNKTYELKEQGTVAIACDKGKFTTDDAQN